jgi:membrane protein
MTYNTLMALFPGLILTASIIGLIGKGSTYDTIREQIELLPEQAAEAILPILDSAVNNQGTALVSFVISLVVGLNGASGALAAAGRGLNVVLGVKEDRGFVRRKVIDIGWTLLLILLTLVAFTLIGSGGAVAEWIFDQIGLGNVAVTIWTILRWPIAVGVAVAIFAIVYYVAPDAEERKFRFLSVGAFAGVFIWILASAGFFLYVSNFGNYEAYGAFAGPVILLLWLWLTNLALLLGAEINAILDEKKHGVSHAAETDSIARQRGGEREEESAEAHVEGGPDSRPGPSTGPSTAERPGVPQRSTGRRHDPPGGLTRGGRTSPVMAVVGLAFSALRGSRKRRS